MKKRINTEDFILKIEKLARARIAGQEVVPLKSFREVRDRAQVKTLLVIEDDITMQGTFQRIFSGENYVVKLASDATTLSLVLDSDPIDLILLDVGLPWINGFELAMMMKEHKDLK